MKNRFISLAVFILSTFASSACGTSFTLLTEELPPFSINNGGSGAGVSIDIVSQLFTRAGFDYHIKIVPWKRAVVTSLNDENTCVFSMPRNQEREASYHWISPIIITQTGFYTRDDSPHKLVTIDDAKGLKIGTYNGSAVAEYLTSWGYEVKLTTKDAQNIYKLYNKRIDVWAADTLSAKYLANEHKITNLKEQLVYFSTLRALACNIKVSEIKVNKLRQELKLMYIDGTIEKIISKYK
ncbi:MAG: transporter substrate-binding domain-containing protein [Colwellia sp.]|nr:transporter substrate-binding domain-containing protein [Colwellia sp.]